MAPRRRPAGGSCPQRAARSGALRPRDGDVAAPGGYDISVREIAEGADRGGTPEQISLHLVASFVLQEPQFGVGLDAFRQHRQTKSPAKAQDRPDNRRGLVV